MSGEQNTVKIHFNGPSENIRNPAVTDPAYLEVVFPRGQTVVPHVLNAVSVGLTMAVKAKGIDPQEIVLRNVWGGTCLLMELPQLGRGDVRLLDDLAFQFQKQIPELIAK